MRFLLFLHFIGIAMGSWGTFHMINKEHLINYAVHIFTDIITDNLKEPFSYNKNEQNRAKSYQWLPKTL